MTEEKQTKVLLATLAGFGYFDAAKQLFGSVLAHGCWSGDLMLLTDKIEAEDRLWFESRGVLVHECFSGENKLAAVGNPDRIMCGRFCLFGTSFRRWDKIVYLDTDIMVEAPLGFLTKISGLVAVWEGCSRGNYHPDFVFGNGNDPAFNSGVFAFDTNIIEDRTEGDLFSLAERFYGKAKNLDQAVLNLYWKDAWHRLPLCFNVSPYHLCHPWFFGRCKIETVVLHFKGRPKIWETSGYYRRRWENNLKRAEEWGPRECLSEEWTEEKMNLVSENLRRQISSYEPVAEIDRLVGLVGRLVRNLLNK